MWGQNLSKKKTNKKRGNEKKKKGGEEKIDVFAGVTLTRRKARKRGQHQKRVLSKWEEVLKAKKHL